MEAIPPSLRHAPTQQRQPHTTGNANCRNDSASQGKCVVHFLFHEFSLMGMIVRVVTLLAMVRRIFMAENIDGGASIDNQQRDKEGDEEHWCEDRAGEE